MTERKTEGPNAYNNARLNAKDAIQEACDTAVMPQKGESVQASLLRAKYGLKSHVRVNSDPAKEQEWNELARIFVQRFQQIHNLPPDSLAGAHSFKVLDATAVGPQVVKHPETGILVPADTIRKDKP